MAPPRDFSEVRRTWRLNYAERMPERAAKTERNDFSSHHGDGFCEGARNSPTIKVTTDCGWAVDVAVVNKETQPSACPRVYCRAIWETWKHPLWTDLHLSCILIISIALSIPHGWKDKVMVSQQTRADRSIVNKLDHIPWNAGKITMLRKLRMALERVCTQAQPGYRAI